MKPLIYYVPFGPLSTDPVRNAVLLFGRALCCCTAVAYSRWWLCLPLSPLSLCSHQLEVTPLVFVPHFKVQRPSAILSKDAAATQRRVLEEVLKSPRRILSSVDLSSDAVNHHRKEMKGLLEY